VVEHGDELPHQPLVGARGQLLLVARHPLAVVVELGLQALERVEVLVALARDDRQGIDLGLDHIRLLRQLVRHLSSTTSYSASSTTSSSSLDEDGPPLPDGCSAEAWA